MKRNCPLCTAEIIYKNIYRKNYAEKNKLMCGKCSRKKMFSKSKTPPATIEKNWSRRCPECNIEIWCRFKYNRDKSIDKLCRSCGIKKMSDGKKGKPLPHLKSWYQSQTDNARKGPFILNCPNCNKSREYKTYWSFQRAQKEQTVCNSCSSILYKKSWTYVIKDSHIKKMAATKAGYDSFTDYMDDFENKKAYWSNVKRLTKHRDIKGLKNYDRLRGIAGIEGAYQLDHIIPISEGYRKGISPEIISDLTNLQIIPWRDNLIKSNKI